MTKPLKVTKIKGLDAMIGTPWEKRWERRFGRMGDVSWKDMPGGGRMIKMMNWFLYRRGVPFAEHEWYEGRMVRQMEEKRKRKLSAVVSNSELGAIGKAGSGTDEVKLEG